MKKHLKTTFTNSTITVDSETGEVIDYDVNETKILAGSKEEFWIIYSSMILIMKKSKDVKMKLLASLFERYSKGQEFSLNASFKQIIADEVGCSARSLDNAFTELVREQIIVKLHKQLYRINPRHVFQGSSSERNKQLKVVLELYCETC